MDEVLLSPIKIFQGHDMWLLIIMNKKEKSGLSIKKISKSVIIVSKTLAIVPQNKLVNK